jgi:alpha-L-fucosidase 2
MKKLFAILLLTYLTIDAFAGRAILHEDVTYKPSKTPPEKKMMLWYGQPAKDGNGTLPFGNGRLGGTVGGGASKEVIFLNEDTMWGGKPRPIDPVNAPETLKKARELSFAGKYSEADKLLTDQLLAKGCISASYHFLNKLNISSELKNKEITNYRRTLDLETAITAVEYECGGVHFTREVFASAVDDVIVVHMKADKPGAISATIELSRDSRNKLEYSSAKGNDTLVYYGQATQTPRAKDLQRFSIPKDKAPLLKGTKFSTHLRAVPVNGKVSVIESKGLKAIKAENCDELILYIAAATDYNKKSPYEPLTFHRDEKCQETLTQVSKKEFAKVRADSIMAHSEPFNRVAINLGDSPTQDMPTDERIKAVQNGAVDVALEALMYQYGRYMLICQARPGTQTGGLRGIWAQSNSCAWKGDYHTNINLQMNYWPAFTGNLAEYQMPQFDMIEGLLPAGRKYASLLGCRGFMFSHSTDPYFYVNLYGALKAGMWVIGGAWCSRDMMEYYWYTGDKTFLEKRAYPIFRECSLFFLDWLVKHPKTGKLVSGPCISPENKFVGGITCMGPAMDQEVIWEVFTHYLLTVEELQLTDPMYDEVKQALAELAWPKIGKDGRLMEWSEDVEEVNIDHRHISHLYSIFPGYQFSAKKTPELFEACKKSIAVRAHHWNQPGGRSIGWANAWTINFYARLYEAEQAHKHIQLHIKNHTYNNLWNNNISCFISDGNGAFSSGIAEMLIQSHASEIDLLPTLPEAWANGSVRGVCARGGFEVSMKWENGKLVSGTILSKLGKTCTLRYGKQTKTFKTEPGKSYDLGSLL